MIGTLLVSAASADPGVDGATAADGAVEPGAADRETHLEGLLQDVEIMDVPTDLDAPAVDWTMLAPIFMVFAAAVSLWLARRRLLGAIKRVPESEMRVVGRTVLAGTAGLSVVEVRGRDGTWRRLVVGTGDGPPRLVADLGEPEFGILGPIEEEEEPSFDQAMAVTAHEEFEPLEIPRSFGLAMRQVRGLPDARGPAAAPNTPQAPAPPIPEADLDREARELIDEVLGERRDAPKRSRWSTFA